VSEPTRGLVLAAFVCFLGQALLTGPAHAHVSSDSYLRIETSPPEEMRGQWDISLRDLDAAVGLEAGDEGAITWGGLKARRQAIEAYAFSRLSIEGCILQPKEMLVDYHAGAAYAVLRFVAACAAQSTHRRLRYQLLFDLDPTHRGLLTIVAPSAERSEVLSPDRPEVEILETPATMLEEFGQFLALGVSHILLGYDHLLFIAVLMIYSPFRRESSGAWTPLDSFGQSMWEAVKILTAFTLAHATALALALLGFVDAPARYVDPAVAMTIMLAAIDNLRSILPRARTIVAFGFGLVHGLAFATALTPMRLSTAGLLLSLAGFNFGVELGQLLFALLLIPIVFVVRRKRIYLVLLAPALTMMAFALALLWFVNRLRPLLQS
jgi:hypothetical protein